MFKIGSIALEQAVLLAPMEDVTDISYRLLCKELGADIVYTEFVNSDGLIRDCQRAHAKMKLLSEERPAGIQIYGHSIASMVEAAKMANRYQPDILDINAGCWVKKVSKRGAGSGLLKDPAYLFKLVKQIVEISDNPVTVKTRLGWDHESINIVEVAKGIEDAGAVALTLHCRTRSMGHSGEADWSWIKLVKQQIDIPIVLNGDVMSGEDAQKAFETTPCDGVMIARGAIGQPWVFREAKEIIKYGKVLTPNSVLDRINICLRHLKRHIEYKGERRAIPSFRKYYAGYLKGLPRALQTRKKLVLLNEYSHIKEVLLEFRDSFKDNSLRPTLPAKAAS